MSHDAPLTFYSDVTVAYGTKNPAQFAGKKDQSSSNHAVWPFDTIGQCFFFITKFVYRIRFYLFILYCFNKVQYEP